MSYKKAQIAEQRELRAAMEGAYLIMGRELNRIIGQMEVEPGSFAKYSYIKLCDIYLCASLSYYELDESVMTDELFDKLCRYLLEQYDVLEMVGVWHVGRDIVKGNLEAGTCIGVDFPVPIHNIAHFLRQVQADELLEMVA